MNIFSTLHEMEHEQLVLCNDNSTGLRAIIAVHDTTLGPALGGTRMWQYASDAEAITDALRLSRGMTYKAAVAGLNLGGGKAVIIGDSRTQKSEKLFRAYGRYVETLKGRYITAEDVGTSVRDMEWIRTETNHVTGVASGSGDPSPVTAWGVYHGMKAAAKKVFGSDSLTGKKIAVQGAGNVAKSVIEYANKENAIMYVTDIYEEKAQEICKKYDVQYVRPEEIHSIDCDIFCPNALGAILNDTTIPELRCAIVAGGANNQLAEETKHGEALRARGILYAPDYVINAGGLMNVASEIEGYNRQAVLNRAQGIYDILLAVIEKAEKENILTIQASNKIAEERIAGVRGIAKIRA